MTVHMKRFIRLSLSKNARWNTWKIIVIPLRRRGLEMRYVRSLLISVFLDHMAVPYPSKYISASLPAPTTRIVPRSLVSRKRNRHLFWRFGLSRSRIFGIQIQLFLLPLTQNPHLLPRFDVLALAAWDSGHWCYHICQSAGDYHRWQLAVLHPGTQKTNQPTKSIQPKWKLSS